MAAPLSKAARDALARIAAGRFHNATSKTLRELTAAGLITAEHPPAVTTAGRERVQAARERAVDQFHRTRSVGQRAHLQRWEKKP